MNRILLAALLAVFALRVSAQAPIDAPKPAPQAEKKEEKKKPAKKPAKKPPPKKAAAKKADDKAATPIKTVPGTEQRLGPGTYSTGPTVLRDKDGNIIPTDPNAYNVDSAKKK